MAEKFENDVFHEVFSVYTMPEKFEKALISSHFGFVFEENSGREIA